jgi:hypothetical protein
MDLGYSDATYTLFIRTFSDPMAKSMCFCLGKLAAFKIEIVTIPTHCFNHFGAFILH